MMNIKNELRGFIPESDEIFDLYEEAYTLSAVGVGLLVAILGDADLQNCEVNADFIEEKKKDIIECRDEFLDAYGEFIDRELASMLFDEFTKEGDSLLANYLVMIEEQGLLEELEQIKAEVLKSCRE